jgi:hypothetical protein
LQEANPATFALENTSMLRKLLYPRAAVLALVLVALVPTLSQAATCRGQPIYAFNNTSHPLWVAAKYIPPGSDCFVTSGFWYLPPGQSQLLLYNSNRWIYFYARNDQGETTLRNVTTAVLGNETLPMEVYDTGMCFNPWTLTFNP